MYNERIFFLCFGTENFWYIFSFPCILNIIEDLHISFQWYNWVKWRNVIRMICIVARRNVVKVKHCSVWSSESKYFLSLLRSKSESSKSANPLKCFVISKWRKNYEINSHFISIRVQLFTENSKNLCFSWLKFCITSFVQHCTVGLQVQAKHTNIHFCCILVYTIYISVVCLPRHLMKE